MGPFWPCGLALARLSIRLPEAITPQTSCRLLRVANAPVDLTIQLPENAVRCKKAKAASLLDHEAGRFAVNLYDKCISHSICSQMAESRPLLVFAPFDGRVQPFISAFLTRGYRRIKRRFLLTVAFASEIGIEMFPSYGNGTHERDLGRVRQKGK